MTRTTRTTRHRKLVALPVAALMLIAVACARRGTPDEGNEGSGNSVQPTASSSSVSPTLENTDWKLTALGDKAVVSTDSLRAAHITLSADTKKVAGSGGCNRMFGSYQLSGAALTFGSIGSTKMACPDGMATESEFLASLGRVAAWRITGQQLELADSSGQVVARFEPRASK